MLAGYVIWTWEVKKILAEVCHNLRCFFQYCFKPLDWFGVKRFSIMMVCNIFNLALRVWVLGIVYAYIYARVPRYPNLSLRWSHVGKREARRTFQRRRKNKRSHFPKVSLYSSIYKNKYLLLRIISPCYLHLVKSRCAFPMHCVDIQWLQWIVPPHFRQKLKATEMSIRNNHHGGGH